ncbi:unnamed protein product [Lactuca saligna]|uniref:NOG C-terminal domain-containing protein n=1 Tax=Lactuca saligna TaxID=75948 RepID=A0AA35VU77_LACSI|nr:unnamed protein product [Lactuca saligna]
MPKPRDQKERLVCIPKSVLEAKAMEAEKVKRKLEMDNENENGGAGVYSASLKKHYLLVDDKWKEDNMSEILDGHNAFNFIDQDILQRLEELEKEEGLLQEQGDGEDEEMEGEDLTPEQQQELNEIRKKKRSNKKMKIRSKSRSMSRSRSISRPPVHELVPDEGYKDSAQKLKAFKMGKSSVHKRHKAAKKNEGDRVILTLNLLFR